MHSEARLCLSGSVSDKRLPATAELCSIFCLAGCGKGDKNHRISRWEKPIRSLALQAGQGTCSLGLAYWVTRHGNPLI